MGDAAVRSLTRRARERTRGLRFRFRPPARMFVHAGDLRELLPARFEKGVAPAHTDLFQCLQAVRDERRTNHEQLLHAGFAEPHKFFIGIRLQPWLTPES